VMMRARRSRSASAWRLNDRFQGVGQEDILDLSQRAIPSRWGTDLPTTGKRPLTLSSDPER
jgi:hypothetical protein